MSNKIWYLKYDHKGRRMMEEMDDSFEESFKGELDKIYTELKIDHSEVRNTDKCIMYVSFPIIQRIEVFTKNPDIWKDMMAENFASEKEALRADVMKAMGVVR